jgi:hypothetical protein
MKIKYDGNVRDESILEILGKIFSISYYDWDETPKAFSITILGRTWHWLVGEWEEEE